MIKNVETKTINKTPGKGKTVDIETEGPTVIDAVDAYLNANQNSTSGSGNNSSYGGSGSGGKGIDHSKLK